MLSPENTNNYGVKYILEQRHNFLLVEYGRKNGDQVYGGATAIIYCNNGILKPCFFPIYVSSSLIGIIYFMYNDSTKGVSAHIESNPSNSNYRIRIFGIGIR